jgi:hypothetical protein
VGHSQRSRPCRARPHSDAGLVQDAVARVRYEFGSSLGQARRREDSTRICRLIYDGVLRRRFGYEFEPRTDESAQQVIRTPLQIETHRTANCIELACLFASMLEAARQAPVIVVVEAPGVTHALVGYRAPDEPGWEAPSLAVVRHALDVGDIVLFEPTGSVEADQPIGAETAQERHNKVLDFMDAKTGAQRMIINADVRIKYFVDVRRLRESSPNPQE